MIAVPSLHWRAVLILAAGAILALSDRGGAETTSVSLAGTPTNVEEWRTTDLSILDFVTDGYDLVSVISPSSHTRLYFLTKPGKIVKCREEATPINPPPIPPQPPRPGQTGTLTPSPPSPSPGQGGAFVPPPPEIAGFRTEFECAELLRGASKQ